MRLSRVVLFGFLYLAFALFSVSQEKAKPKLVAIRAARMLDVKSGQLLRDATVLIEGDKITAVGSALNIPPSAEVLNLGDVTLLPGLIDCHTHIMARVPDGPNTYGLNLLTKSYAFRALEGAADARITLHAGFTSVRDVENEGSGYADVALRDAIRQQLVEGPRMQVATRAIAALGRYQPFGISSDLQDFPTGAQMISGVEDTKRLPKGKMADAARYPEHSWVLPLGHPPSLRMTVS
jgi:hypothetical protein